MNLVVDRDQQQKNLFDRYDAAVSALRSCKDKRVIVAHCISPGAHKPSFNDVILPMNEWRNVEDGTLRYWYSGPEMHADRNHRPESATHVTIAMQIQDQRTNGIMAGWRSKIFSNGNLYIGGRENNIFAYDIMIRPSSTMQPQVLYSNKVRTFEIAVAMLEAIVDSFDSPNLVQDVLNIPEYYVDIPSSEVRNLASEPAGLGLKGRLISAIQGHNNRQLNCTISSVDGEVVLVEEVDDVTGCQLILIRRNNGSEVSHIGPPSCVAGLIEAIKPGVKIESNVQLYTCKLNPNISMWSDLVAAIGEDNANRLAYAELLSRSIKDHGDPAEAAPGSDNMSFVSVPLSLMPPSIKLSSIARINGANIYECISDFVDDDGQPQIQIVADQCASRVYDFVSVHDNWDWAKDLEIYKMVNPGERQRYRTESSPRTDNFRQTRSGERGYRGRNNARPAVYQQ